MRELDDVDIVERVRSGDVKAFTLLVRKYELPLLKLVTKYLKDLELARDVVQEGFLKTYQTLDRFEYKCSFKNWLYKITLNTARNKIRSLKSHENIEDVSLIQHCFIEKNLIHQEIVQRLRDLVELLPEKQKQSIELRVFKDLSFKQVAVAMDCPYDTAKANYRHAMLKIKEFFQHEMEQLELI